MESIDVECVNLTRETVLSQRNNKLYFKVQGELSAYKLFSKALDFHQIFDYMAISFAKMRMWESCTLAAQTGNRE